jgi:hypothetical protein
MFEELFNLIKLKRYEVSLGSWRNGTWTCHAFRLICGNCKQEILTSLCGTDIIPNLDCFCKKPDGKSDCKPLQLMESATKDLAIDAVKEVVEKLYQ